MDYGVCAPDSSAQFVCTELYRVSIWQSPTKTAPQPDRRPAATANCNQLSLAVAARDSLLVVVVAIDPPWRVHSDRAARSSPAPVAMPTMRPASVEQDGRYSNKSKKLAAGLKCAPELAQKVDMQKVKFDVLKPWVTKRITELLGA